MFSISNNYNSGNCGSSGNVIELNIDPNEEEALISLLKFVYTVERPDRDYKKLIALYELADKYCYSSLKYYCELQLCLSLKPNIVIDLLILAYKSNSTLLESKAIEYLTSKAKGLLTIKETISKLLKYPALMLKIAQSSKSAC